MNTRNARDFIKHKHGSTKLTKQLQHQASLEKATRKVLPSFLADHCQNVIVGRSGNVILYTDSAAWASQLRFYEVSIIQQLSALSLIPSQTRLTVRITPQIIWEYPQRKIPKKPSNDAITCITSQANHSAQDEITESLGRLAQTLQKCR